MEIRIEGSDLPGRNCSAGPGFPGADNVHVGVQRKDRPGELLGLHPGDAGSASWSLECTAVSTETGVELRGPYIQNRLGGRFVYLSWVTVDEAGAATMFRRAKLMLDAVEPAVVEAAMTSGRLTARLRLTDARGRPLCAAVRPPLVDWRAEPQG